jgi:DNA-binding CsgD family transcriptional regulator
VRSLTERETEVLACLGEGLSNAQIARRLYLSEATIKGYVSRMLDKLQCANRTQAGLLAHDAGLVGRQAAGGASEGGRGGGRGPGGGQQAQPPPERRGQLRTRRPRRAQAP